MVQFSVPDPPHPLGHDLFSLGDNFLEINVKGPGGAVEKGAVLCTGPLPPLGHDPLSNRQFF